MPKDIEFRSSSHKGDASVLNEAAVGGRERPIHVEIGTLDAGQSIEARAGPRFELTICYGGVLRMRTEGDVWFVPSKHGIWIPGGFRHTLTARTPVEVHRLFIAASDAKRVALPGKPTVVGATPLLRGIAQRLSPDASFRLTRAEAQRLAWVAFDEMARLRRPDMRLPGGQDPRLVSVMDHLVRHPQDRRGLGELARLAGTSERTLGRLFTTETGLTFGDWRRRLRFMFALERLGFGETSTALAKQLGYSSASAFIAAFKAYFGDTPSAYRRS